MTDHQTPKTTTAKAQKSRGSTAAVIILTLLLICSCAGCLVLADYSRYLTDRNSTLESELDSTNSRVASIEKAKSKALEDAAYYQSQYNKAEKDLSEANAENEAIMYFVSSYHASGCFEEWIEKNGTFDEYSKRYVYETEVDMSAYGMKDADMSITVTTSFISGCKYIVIKSFLMTDLLEYAVYHQTTMIQEGTSNITSALSVRNYLDRKKIFDGSILVKHSDLEKPKPPYTKEDFFLYDTHGNDYSSELLLQYTNLAYCMMRVALTRVCADASATFEPLASGEGFEYVMDSLSITDAVTSPFSYTFPGADKFPQ